MKYCEICKKETDKIYWSADDACCLKCFNDINLMDSLAKKIWEDSSA